MKYQVIIPVVVGCLGTAMSPLVHAEDKPKAPETKTEAAPAASAAPAAVGDHKAKVTAALAKLKDAASYAWTSKTSMEPSRFPMPITKGVATKDGWLLVSSEPEDREPTLALISKEGGGVIKTDEGWKTAAEMPQPEGGGGRGRNWGAQMILRSRSALQDIERWVEGVTEYTDAEGVLSSTLSEEKVKELSTFGRGGRGGRGGGGEGRPPGGDRPGGGGGEGGPPAPPPIENASGSVSFELKDGAISKAVLKTSGDFTFRDEPVTMARTVTITFNDVGTAKLDVSEEAKKAALAAPKGEVNAPRPPRPPRPPQ